MKWPGFGLTPPVGDSARQAGERLTACLSELVQKHQGAHLLIVTHGGLITDFLVHVFPEEELRRVQERFLEEQTRLIAECSITHVQWNHGSFRLVDFASVRHLD